MTLFKKGSRKKSENYRPVSLTSVASKLLETFDAFVLFLSWKTFDTDKQSLQDDQNKLVKLSEK